VAYCHPDAYDMAADVFYRNRGDGTFEDATREAGFLDTDGKGLGCLAADLDLDGDQDVYVANDSTPNFVWENQGNGTFVETGLWSGAGYNEDGKTEAGMAVDFGDVNLDGRPDIVVTNLDAEANALYLGTPDGFVHDSRHAHLQADSFPLVGFGADLLDVDNDADLDLYVANGHVIDNIAELAQGKTWEQPDHLFLNDGEGVFALVHGPAVAAISVPRPGRATLTLDVNDDGRLDVLVTHSRQQARLYRNVFPPTNRWIGFRLRGRAPNPDAIGARVIVESGGRAQGLSRTAGGSYQGSQDPRLHFGLGRATEVERVTVHWADGTEEAFERLAAGRYWTLEQGRAPR
jgi:hypothetical protein